MNRVALMVLGILVGLGILIPVAGSLVRREGLDAGCMSHIRVFFPRQIKWFTLFFDVRVREQGDVVGVARTVYAIPLYGVSFPSYRACIEGDGASVY